MRPASAGGQRPQTYRPPPAEHHVRILRAELTALAALADTAPADLDGACALLAQIREQATRVATKEFMRAKVTEQHEARRQAIRAQGEKYRQEHPEVGQ